MDPCQIYGDGGTQPCTIDYIEIGLEAPAPRPGVCRRDFIAVRPQAATGQRIWPPGGGARLALGSTCATLPAAAFARVSGPHGQDRDDEDDIAAATDLLSWLQRQQAAIRDGLHTGNPSTTPGLFIEHCTTAISLDDLAKRNGVSRATMKRRFKWCWLVDVPDPTAGHHKRIYDQVFLDGTYTAGGCLIVAATIDHVIAWHWCKHETTRDYQLLLERIEAPLIAVIDGGQGAYSAIKKCWPTTKIQRCLIHAQRVVRRYTTTNPRTDAGRTIYRLALKLTRITTLDEAAAWGVQLHEFSTIYREWMNEKTMIKDPKTGAWTRVWTHHNVRKAYNSLNHLWRSEMLFVYLNPPAGVLAPERIKSTTNSLEGGINAQLKLLARTHRGRSGERQRRMLDWWLYLKTELPDDPVRIARQSDWGQGQLAKVSTLTQTENQADHETGRPALYDNAIDTDYTHSIGIQKGQI